MALALTRWTENGWVSCASRMCLYLLPAANPGRQMDHCFAKDEKRTGKRGKYSHPGKLLVLMINVGPKSSKKQSDICQKSVRKLSVTKISQKTVRNVSDISQKTVSCKYLSELC